MIDPGKKNRALASLLVVFALLSMLLPARLLFACDLLDGKISSQCCCEENGAKGCAMGGGCGPDGHDKMAFPTAENTCCAVSLDEPPVYDRATVGSVSIGVGALVQPSQPPPALSAAPLAVPTAQAGRTKAFFVVASPDDSEPAILLVTQRFRI